jgi:hypothetical protein
MDTIPAIIIHAVGKLFAVCRLEDHENPPEHRIIGNARMDIDLIENRSRPMKRNLLE